MFVCLLKLIESKKGRLVDKWILNELVETIKSVEHNFENEYQFQLIVKQLREFFYGAYCDFYLESTKRLLKKTDNVNREAASEQQEFIWNILRVCSRTTLLMYHPFMPSLTEELWNKYKMGGEDESILETNYPKYAEIAKFSVGCLIFFAQ